MVTGDAVVLDVQIAQLPVRALSALIDLTVVGTCYLFVLLVGAAALPDLDEAFVAAVVVIFSVAVVVGYPVTMEMATRGRSLGKMAMGLRVVSDDGGPERFRQALFRALAGVVEIWMLLGSPAVIASMLSAKGKRIGDMFAGTVVVSERGPKLAAPPVMPPALAWWAQSLELSGLGAQQAQMARQFLARAPELNPAVRDEMGCQIAAEVISEISPPPPAGVRPAELLAAVLAERHRRELARLWQPIGPVMPYPMADPVQYPTSPAPPPGSDGLVPPT